MVSNASEDLPEPESPVMTVRVFRGISTLMFFRLCCRAPRITSLVRPISRKRPLPRGRAFRMQTPAPSSYTEPTLTPHDSKVERIRSRKSWEGNWNPADDGLTQNDSD